METIYQYVLTDGQDVYQQAEMTQDQADQANQIAQQHTDGNVWWAKL